MITWLLIFLFLPTVTLTHVVASRLSIRNRQLFVRHRTALQSIFSVILSFTMINLLYFWQTANLWTSTSYLLISIISLSHIYFLMFCNSETGRRYFLMNLLSKKTMSNSELREAYSHQYIISMRIKRLLHWKILCEQNGRLQLANKNSLRFSKIHQVWAKILGFSWPSK